MERRKVAPHLAFIGLKRLWRPGRAFLGRNGVGHEELHLKRLWTRGETAQWPVSQRGSCSVRHLKNDPFSMAFNVFSQQQNALAYNLSMQGIGTVAIDGPRLEPG